MSNIQALNEPSLCQTPHEEVYRALHERDISAFHVKTEYNEPGIIVSAAVTLTSPSDVAKVINLPHLTDASWAPRKNYWDVNKVINPGPNLFSPGLRLRRHLWRGRCLDGPQSEREEFGPSVRNRLQMTAVGLPISNSFDGAYLQTVAQQGAGLI
ncbi:hypothetical protein E1B28_000429 [Marasmius oreades]|uniref:Uncharacterized protein n=1 Tax=Marasmius oreades TaxID=181124 RepID=A0A9P7V1A5_9AGAR|nr:uncharacterized protein E1B28_000429 [Marasmius oreades]KAG7098484.1 hypothetical protein E1B28_000429 [Marasmius oreades]